MRLKSAIKRIMPGRAWHGSVSVFLALKALLAGPRVRRARKIFDEASAGPAWLQLKDLETLQRKYSPPPEYGYDPSALEKRGQERAAEILSLVGRGRGDMKDFLELGCWDGMVSCILRRMGKSATAVDNRSEGFDERAVREGVKLMRMDAAGLKFEDGSFDFVFSYDAFEHFADPAAALREAARVVRERGYIYLDFGPLYMSAMGLHAYRSVSVPYAQFLFSKETLTDFVRAKGLKPIDFAQVNGWSAEDYRRLWKSYSGRLQKIIYNEHTDFSHLDLVVRYPACFKGKIGSFDDLVISGMTVLFKKIRR